jgi:hypothetical protein
MFRQIAISRVFGGLDFSTFSTKSAETGRSAELGGCAGFYESTHPRVLFLSELVRGATLVIGDLANVG